jgi:hypothetical protein
MIHPSLFLRRALQLDAIVTGAMALLLVFGDSALAPLLNLPEAMLRDTGLFLIAYTAVVGWLATRPAMPKLAGAGGDRRQRRMDRRQHRIVVQRRGDAQFARRGLCLDPGHCDRRLRRTAIYRTAPERQRSRGLIVVAGAAIQDIISFLDCFVYAGGPT